MSSKIKQVAKKKTKIKEIKIEDQPHVISCMQRPYANGRRRRAGHAKPNWKPAFFVYQNHATAVTGLRALSDMRINPYDDFDDENLTPRYKDFKLHTVNEGKSIGIKVIVE